MLLRLIVFLGVALVAIAGGAAGWQYWQSLPKTAEVAVEAPVGPTGPQLTVVGEFAIAGTLEQTWMISPGGGLIERDEARKWLKQDAFLKGRDIMIEFTAPLSALLEEGEALPGLAYRQAFADIRAKKLAQEFCAPLLKGFAAACAVNQATLEEDSLDEAGETATFNVELIYALEPEVEPLPDLAAKTLHDDSVRVSAEETGPEAAASPVSFLAHALSVTTAACAEKSAHCRMTGMYVKWTSPTEADASANIGWLMPLPNGIYPAPPLY